MKKSLKYLTLILSIIVLTSCSNNDDGSTENSIDPLIGSWKYSTQFENDIQITVNDCKPSTIEITLDGYRTDLYYGIDGSGNCVVVDTVNMTWGTFSDGIYSDETYAFSLNSFAFVNTAIFENENNTLTLESSDTDGNGNVIIYRFVYTRIVE